MIYESYYKECSVPSRRARPCQWTEPDYPTAKELTEALAGEWNAHRRSGSCLCPAHTDADPSLDITAKGGRTLVICRAGCSQDAVFDELRGRGHWPERKSKANGANGHAGQPKTIVATYGYQLRDGREHFQVVRFAPKTFRPRRADGKGGTFGICHGLSAICPTGSRNCWRRSRSESPWRS